MQRALSANSAAILGVLMGVIGFFVSLYPPASGSCAQAILATIFAALVVVALLAILIPEYRKASLDDPERIMNEAFSLVTDIVGFSNIWRMSAPVMNDPRELELHDSRLKEFNRVFRENFTTKFGGRIQKLIDRFRLNEIILQQQDGFYWPDPLTPSSFEVESVDRKETGNERQPIQRGADHRGAART
ncbi:MAG: hypothetical protein WCA22_20060 [Candidatus Binatus sp.]